MKLLNTINIILREEIEIPTILRRRLRQLDDELHLVLRNFPDRISMCDFKDEEEFLEYIIETSIENTYWTYFGNVDISSELWNQLYRGMLTYYRSRFGEGIIERYRHGCTNSSINEEIDSLPIKVKRRYPEIKKMLKWVTIRTDACDYDDFLSYKTGILGKIIERFILEHTYEHAIQMGEIVNHYFMDEIEEHYNEEMKNC
jgi:hypothetical protein